MTWEQSPPGLTAAKQHARGPDRAAEGLASSGGRDVEGRRERERESGEEGRDPREPPGGARHHREGASERDASACSRRHQVNREEALAPVV